MGFWNRPTFRDAVAPIVLALIILGIGAVFLVTDPYNGGSRPIPDLVRNSDLRETQNALELYYKKCGYFPGIAQPGATCSAFAHINTWGDLTQALEDSDLGFSNKIPNDPTPGKTYFYGTDASGTAYVLGAAVSINHYNFWSSQTTGTVFGVNCDAPVYCVEESPLASSSAK